MTAKKTVKPVINTEKQSSAQIILKYLNKIVKMSDATCDVSKIILNPVLTQNIERNNNVKVYSNDLTPLFREIHNSIEKIEENLLEINFTLSNVEVNY